MTAIRNFPDSPARFVRPAARRHLPAWALKMWQMLGESAQGRADAELARVVADPVLARQLRAAVAANHGGAAALTPVTSSRGGS